MDCLPGVRFSTKLAGALEQIDNSELDASHLSRTDGG